MKKKPYEVVITHSYLLEAVSESEAMRRSMERFMGRPNNDVAFDGMVVNCVITQRPVPFTLPVKKSRIKHIIKEEQHDNSDIEPTFDDIVGDRTDSKEQDYIHFSAADEL